MNTHFDLNRHHRHSMRLQGFDYTQEGAYFVTVCIQDRACLFGDISDGKMILNEAGLMAERHWHDIPTHFPHIELDEFVIMPNHVHGIIVINCRGESRIRPGDCHEPNSGDHKDRPYGTTAGSVGRIIRRSNPGSHMNTLWAYDNKYVLRYTDVYGNAIIMNTSSVMTYP